MKIFFYRTGWALLLYMLYEPDWEKALYCFPEGKSVPNYFREYGIHYFVYRRNDDGAGRVRKAWKRLQDEVRYLRFTHWLKTIPDKHCVGDDDSILSKAFVHDDFMVMEDGLANYTPENIAYLRNTMSLGFGCQFKVMGYDPIIKKVLLAGEFAIPEQLKNKAIVVNVKKLWEAKTQKEKEKILSVFETSVSELDSYKSDFVLLTQNFDSYDIQSTETEYSRYVKILKNYPYGKVIIKPHSSSNFNYLEYFPDYKVVRQGIPFELMALYNNYRVLISINSTAAFTVPNKERVDLYDLDGDLKKRFYASETKNLRAEEIKLDKLVPKWDRWDSWLGMGIRKARWLFLRKFVWHLK